jgi:signal peptidase I
MKNRRIWPIRLAKISGESMAPTYRSGERVLVLMFSVLAAKVSIGDVVLIEREVMPGIFFIKRVIKKQGTTFWVEGDNNEPEVLTRMNDSRNWGHINQEEIKGRLLIKRKRKAIN